MARSTTAAMVMIRVRDMMVCSVIGRNYGVKLSRASQETCRIGIQCWRSAHAFDPRTDGVQPLIDVLVTAIDLFDVVDRTGPFGAQRCDQQCDTRADIGARHGDRAQRL